MNSIIWTRALEYKNHDIKLLEDLDLFFLHLPCIFFKTIHNDKILTNYKTLKKKIIVFTSSHAVHCFLKCEESHILLQDSNIITIGESTHKTLKKHDYSSLSLKKNSYAKYLSKLITKNYDSTHSILLPGPKKRYYDLKKDLQKKNYRVFNINLYETIKEARNSNNTPLTNSQKLDLATQTKGAICFASPSAVNGFAQSFKPFWTYINQNLTAVCIGESTLSEAKIFFKQTIIANETKLKSLLSTAFFYLKSTN